MWPLRAAIFLLCCAGCWCQSCNLTKAYFKSKNFFSVLHWDAVDIPGQTVLYSVQYNFYGNSYQPVTWCQNISAPFCDLTDAMSVVLTDISIKCHAKITVDGQCVGDAKFVPFRQTTLAAPQLSVASNKTHLNVTVSPPMIPWNRSIESIRAWGGIKYIVHLTQPKSVEGKVFENTSRSVFIWLVETDVQYCGDVVYTLTHPGWPNHSESASFCVSVSDPNSWFHILMWPGLLALLLLLIILPIMLCQLSVKRKPSLPKVLMLSNNNSPPFCSDPRDYISKVEVRTGYDPLAIFPQQKVNVNAYASQEPYRCQQDVPVHNSAESSVHYSLCLPDQNSNEPSSDGRTEETSLDSTGSESVLIISDTESSSETLVVPVRPTENGELRFHDCLFQLNTHLSSPAAARESEGLTGEQTPLLTDLNQKDFRCNSSYLSVHVPDIMTSNYRQNWVPGIPLEGNQDQRTYIQRTDHLQDLTKPEEDFRDEEEQRVGVIILDRWALEMPGLSLSCN
nr:cytokine receptor family member B14a [Megalobrama amblycephala]